MVSRPAAAVRGPKHVVTKGATPVLSPAEAMKLLETIDTGALAGLRDRALLSVMLYSFARVSAVLGMRRQDYFGQGSRGWLRLHEKGGKRHDVPVHHRAAAALDVYVEAARLEEPKVALFQTVDPAFSAIRSAMRGDRVSGCCSCRFVRGRGRLHRSAAAGFPAGRLSPAWSPPSGGTSSRVVTLRCCGGGVPSDPPRRRQRHKPAQHE